MTQTQRYQIYAHHDLGGGQRQIARKLGLHSSTISCALRRSTTASGYDPEHYVVA
ncbi:MULTISPECIES: helix-turn-helix domain-containing protein [Halomonadaceae]|uniref:helix-turn-helix domain-containing protein n=1 Tax=Marinobacter piscensis TaxID=1562308 RepID=UPI001C9309E1|nr:MULTISPECIES: helix-turn-helix domain-containing protein [Halomonas]